MRGMGPAKNAAGPISRYVDDLVLVMKAWWADRKGLIHKVDPAIPHLPFRDHVYNDDKKLRIGYYLSDDLFPTSAPVKRAILEAVELLKQRGHTVVEFKPKHTRELMLLYGSHFTADGMKDFFSQLQGEPPLKQYALMKFICSLPGFVRDSLSSPSLHCWLDWSTTIESEHSAFRSIDSQPILG